MSRLLTFSLGLSLLVACGGATPAPSPASPATAEAPAAQGQRSDVTIDEFIAKHGGGDISVIDVRTPGEYAGGHVPGSVLAPVQELSPDHPAVKDHPKDEPLYIICQSGGRSSRAADMLAKAGYTTVNIQGGTGAWIGKGQPTDK